jgi:hypothetical protein
MASTGLDTGLSQLSQQPSIEEQQPQWEAVKAKKTSTEEQQKFRKKLIGVSLVVVGVLGFGWVLSDMLSAFGEDTPAKLVTSAWNPDGVKEEQKNKWLEEIEKNRDKPLLNKGVEVQAQPSKAPVVAVADDVPPPKGGVSHLANEQATRANRKQGGKRPAKVAVEPEPANPYAAMYGTQYTNTGTLVQSGSTDEAGQPSVTGSKGLRIKARLADDIASQPANAPVIATVTSSITLGDRVIPTGSEVHGVVSGGTETRVQVTFHTVRTPAGETISIAGVARGTRGRVGIPGKKNVDVGTASNVAADAIVAVGQETGNVLADAVDNTIGKAGVRAGVGSASKNGKRFDNSELVVIVRKGARFEVYLTK